MRILWLWLFTIVGIVKTTMAWIYLFTLWLFVQKICSAFFKISNILNVNTNSNLSLGVWAFSSNTRLKADLSVCLFVCFCFWRTKARVKRTDTRFVVGFYFASYARSFSYQQAWCYFIFSSLSLTLFILTSASEIMPSSEVIFSV